MIPPGVYAAKYVAVLCVSSLPPTLFSSHAQSAHEVVSLLTRCLSTVQLGSGWALSREYAASESGYSLFG